MAILSILLFVLLTSANFLFFNAYPLLAPESLLFMGLLALLLFLPYFIFSAIGLEWFFHGLLAALFLDLSWGWVDDLTLLPRGTFSPYFPFLIPLTRNLAAPFNQPALLGLSYSIFLVPFLLLAFFLRRHTAKILTVGFAAMLAVTLAKFALNPEPLFRSDVNETQASKAPEKPPVLIFILDEHTGIEGLPLIHEGAEKLKNDLIEKYTQNGFRLYGRAYTNYFQTHFSIPSLLNHFIWQDGAQGPPEANRFLEKFHEEGYALNLYQSSYVEFCRPLKKIYRQCHQYKHNSVGFLLSAPRPFFERALVIFSAFFEAHQSVLLQKTITALSKRWKILPWGHVEPLPTFAVLEKMKTDLVLQKSGALFFAHLLIPHSPYVFDRECNVKPVLQWENRYIYGDDLEAARRKKQAHYLEQVACTHKKLGEFFDWMKQEGTFEKAVIVLLGDHGGRIYSKMLYEEQKERLTNIDEMTKRDVIELFSTFLAVKTAGRGAYIPEKIPVAQVLYQTFPFPPLEETPEDRFKKIYLASEDERARKYFPYDMIDF